MKAGYWGRNNKANDIKLINRIKAVLDSPTYKPDTMTESVRGYVNRYDRIKSLTDRMRYDIRVHIEKHTNDRGEIL